MAITQIIATLPAVLNDSETFYEDIAIRNNSLVTVSFPSINTWATQANALAVEVNDKALQVAAQAVDGGYSQDYINDNFFSQDYINTNFVGVNNAQNITKVKTFTASPIVPTPTTDFQAATKKYVDDNNKINTLTNKTTPVDADEMVISDSALSFNLKKLSFASLKAWIKDKIAGNLGTQSDAITTSFTLTQAHAGKMQVCINAITITLPAINTIISGSCFIIKNGIIDNVTLNLNGNTIEDTYSTKVTGGETLVIQSDGGFFYRVVSRTSRTPMYEDQSTSLSYNVTYQADGDMTVVVLLEGTYINGAQLLVGNTSTPTTVIGYVGDDINNNTKRTTLTAVITAGMYFKVTPYGGGFETINILAYKHK